MMRCYFEVQDKEGLKACFFLLLSIHCWLKDAILRNFQTNMPMPKQKAYSSILLKQYTQEK